MSGGVRDGDLPGSRRVLRAGRRIPGEAAIRLPDERPERRPAIRFGGHDRERRTLRVTRGAEQAVRRASPQQQISDQSVIGQVLNDWRLDIDATLRNVGQLNRDGCSRGKRRSAIVGDGYYEMKRRSRLEVERGVVCHGDRAGRGIDHKRARVILGSDTERMVLAGVRICNTDDADNGTNHAVLRDLDRRRSDERRRLVDIGNGNRERLLIYAAGGIAGADRQRNIWLCLVIERSASRDAEQPGAIGEYDPEPRIGPGHQLEGERVAVGITPGDYPDDISLRGIFGDGRRRESDGVGRSINADSDDARFTPATIAIADDDRHEAVTCRAGDRLERKSANDGLNAGRRCGGIERDDEQPFGDFGRSNDNSPTAVIPGQQAASYAERPIWPNEQCVAVVVPASDRRRKLAAVKVERIHVDQRCSDIENDRANTGADDATEDQHRRIVDRHDLDYHRRARDKLAVTDRDRHNAITRRRGLRQVDIVNTAERRLILGRGRPAGQCHGPSGGVDRRYDRGIAHNNGQNLRRAVGPTAERDGGADDIRIDIVHRQPRHNGQWRVVFDPHERSRWRRDGRRIVDRRDRDGHCRRRGQPAVIGDRVRERIDAIYVQRRRISDRSAARHDLSHAKRRDANDGNGEGLAHVRRERVIRQRVDHHRPGILVDLDRIIVRDGRVIDRQDSDCDRRRRAATVAVRDRVAKRLRAVEIWRRSIEHDPVDYQR